MKIKRFLTGSIVLMLTLVLNSCANAEKAEAVANEFYEKMQKKEYTAIEKMLSDKMIKASSQETVLAFISQKEELGELISFSKEEDGKVMEIDNNQVVRFLYKTEYTSKNLYEYIRVVLTDEVYLIESYGYFDTKEKRDEFLQHAE